MELSKKFTNLETISQLTRLLIKLLELMRKSLKDELNLRRVRRRQRRHSPFPASRRLPRSPPQRRRWMRQWEREVNEINGIAFVGMPGSFPGRNEGEPFHVCCGLNLPPLLLAPPGTALRRSRSLARLRRSSWTRTDVSMRTIGCAFPRLEGCSLRRTADQSSIRSLNF